MSAKKSAESTPIKRLILRREKVRDLNVNTGVKTGLTGECRSIAAPSASMSASGSITSGSFSNIHG